MSDSLRWVRHATLLGLIGGRLEGRAEVAEVVSRPGVLVLGRGAVVEEVLCGTPLALRPFVGLGARLVELLVLERVVAAKVVRVLLDLARHRVQRNQGYVVCVFLLDILFIGLCCHDFLGQSRAALLVVLFKLVWFREGRLAVGQSVARQHVLFGLDPGTHRVVVSLRLQSRNVLICFGHA